MKLGEIKIQAIQLMYPGILIRARNESDGDLNCIISELKSNSSLSPVIEAMTGAVNRALAYLEARGTVPYDCVDIPSTECQRILGNKAKIILPKGLLSIERMYIANDGKATLCEYELFGDYALTEMKSGIYTVIYKKALNRISGIEDEDTEIELLNGIGEALPYFIKADLFSQDSGDEAKEARAVFDGIVERIENRPSPCQGCFESVYTIGG